MSFRLFLATALLLALSACGNDLGTPATISELTITPGTISGASPETLVLQFHFEDPDGDPLEVLLDVRRGTTSLFSRNTMLTPTGGNSRSGILNVVVSFPSGAPLEAGTYDIDVRLRDANGNDSNKLTTQVTVE